MIEARGCPCHGAGVGSERRQDAESEAAIERTKGRMPEVSVRRGGTDNPSPRDTSPFTKI
jgi:hypothetical protein